MNVLALIVCIVGLLLYLMLPTAPNPRPVEAKLSTAGLWAFGIGLAVFLLSAGQLLAAWRP